MLVIKRILQFRTFLRRSSSRNFQRTIQYALVCSVDGTDNDGSYVHQPLGVRRRLHVQAEEQRPHVERQREVIENRSSQKRKNLYEDYAREYIGDAEDHHHVAKLLWTKWVRSCLLK